MNNPYELIAAAEFLTTPRTSRPRKPRRRLVRPLLTKARHLVTSAVDRWHITPAKPTPCIHTCQCC